MAAHAAQDQRVARRPGAPAADLGERLSTKGVLREQVAEIQRSRLLGAAVSVIDELGYEHANIARITARAGVSRRTFYELFANREQCLAAVLDAVVALVEDELAAAGLAGRSWRERMREGLCTILSFLDREPALARVCVVQTLQGGLSVLERRDAILVRLAALVDEGRNESTGSASCTPLTAEGTVGAALAILHARLARRDPGALIDLGGQLAAMIMLPYLGLAAARREQRSPASSASVSAERARSSHSLDAGDVLRGVPMRLTYRTVRVLDGIAEHAGASNRQIADHAGIGDPGQVSKLLARLRGLGLIANHGEGAHARGEPNAWTLTTRGEQIVGSIRIHTTTQ